MKEELKPLLEIQAIDLQIRKIEQDMRVIPERLNVLTSSHDEMLEQIEAIEEEIREMTSQKVNIEDEIELENARLAKDQQKLNGLKTNRDYQAMLKEIEGIKTGNASREEEFMLLIAKSEERQKECEELKAKISQVKGEIEAEQIVVNTATEQAKQQLNGLTAQRDEIVKNAKKDLFARYMFLRDKRAGIALAPISSKASCGGCNMNIPPQLFNELLRDEKIHYCPTCQRFIYIALEPQNDGASQ